MKKTIFKTHPGGGTNDGGYIWVGGSQPPNPRRGNTARDILKSTLNFTDFPSVPPPGVRG